MNDQKTNKTPQKTMFLFQSNFLTNKLVLTFAIFHSSYTELAWILFNIFKRFFLLFRIKICHISNLHSLNVSNNLFLQTWGICAQHCSRAEPTGQDYTMALPDPDSYQDLNSDNIFPGSPLNEITTYLSQFNTNIESKVKNLYNDGFIRYSGQLSIIRSGMLEAP